MIWGLFFRTPAGCAMRTRFLVDGFDLYHSLIDASRALDGAGTRWLDLFGFCRSSLYLLGGDARLEGVHYFSALASHLEPLKPDATVRHLAYIECLRTTGVQGGRYGWRS